MRWIRGGRWRRRAIAALVWSVRRRLEWQANLQPRPDAEIKPIVPRSGLSGSNISVFYLLIYILAINFSAHQSGRHG